MKLNIMFILLTYLRLGFWSSKIFSNGYCTSCIVFRIPWLASVFVMIKSILGMQMISEWPLHWNYTAWIYFSNNYLLAYYNDIVPYFRWLKKINQSSLFSKKSILADVRKNCPNYGLDLKKSIIIDKTQDIFECWVI